MKRRRSPRSRKRRPPDPAEVLAGRAEARLEELFELIHEVNPTGRQLSDTERDRRYEQKAGLQSLLVRRFGDEHLVVEETDDDGVVSLAHRSGTKDACHAVLAELEPDARSWIRHRLDVERFSPNAAEGEHATPAAGRPAPRPSADELPDAGSDELLLRGRQALDEYDYEAAEEHLRLAVEKSGGGVGAASALLELLVDLLGMDRQALELEPRLSAEARRDPGIRTLLALAAARLGETEQALRWVGEIGLARAAEVHAALASRAIAERDPQAAGRHLERVAEHDPVHPRLVELRQAMAALHAELQGPREAALEERAREEGNAAVEAEARALLERWPESQVARRILRELAEDRRRREIQEHLELGDRAFAEERFRDAAHHLQAAVDAGSDRADLADLIARAGALESRRHEQQQVDGVVARLDGGDERGALLAYLALAEPLRAAVRERVDRGAGPRRTLAWIEDIAPPPTGGRAQAAVAAVLALDGVLGHLDSLAGQDVLDALEPHLESLRRVEAARECVEEARSRVAAERAERGHEALEQAFEALAAARLDEARQRLETLDGEALRSADRARLDELSRRLRQSEKVALLEQEYQRQMARGADLEALERARRLVEESAAGGERERWSRRVEELRQRVRSAWGVEVVDDVLPLAELRAFQPPFIASEFPQIWLDDEGRRLVLADVWVHWLFVTVVDLEASAIIARLSLRTPRPLGRLGQNVCVDGDLLRIAGDSGYYLELGLESWEILRWRSLRELLPPEAITENLLIVPGSPYLWAVFRSSAELREWAARVVDVRTWRVCRSLPGDQVQLVPGPSETAVLATHYDAGARLYSPRGTAGPELRLPPGSRVITAGASPGEPEGLWLVAVDEDGGEDEDRVELLAVEPAPRGPRSVRSRRTLADAFEDGSHPLATASEADAAFVLLTNCEQGRELLAFAPPPEAEGEAAPSLLWRRPAPRGAVLVQDRRSRYAAAVHLGPECLTVARLTTDEAAADALGDPRLAPHHEAVPVIGPPFLCARSSGTEGETVSLLGERLRISGHEVVVRDVEREHGDDPDQMAALVLAMALQDREDSGWPALARRLAERFPEVAPVAFVAAEAAAQAGAWDEVCRRLEDVDPGGLDGGQACHFDHLLGLALLRLGRPAEAVKVLERGARIEDGECALDPLLELARLMVDPPGVGGWGPDEPSLRQLVGALHAAERALAAGELEAAREALDRPAVWRAREIQSAARLADVHLRLAERDGPLTGARRFDTRLALAYFGEIHRRDDFFPRGLDVLDLAWDGTRLHHLSRRVAAWLEQDLGGGRRAASGRTLKRPGSRRP